MALARDNRSIYRLMQTASSARVLNLADRPAALRLATPPDATLFRTPALDRAVLVKHRLRPHEQEMFHGLRAVATKILVPIDPRNVSLGAQAILVGERGYDTLLAEHFGLRADSRAGEHDHAVLEALNALPSFDPFLTREHLRRCGFRIAPDYFDISAPDVARMTAFARAEIVPLVRLCFGASADAAKAARLTQKVLSADLDASMEPLRLTFKMSPEQFVEGIFCWKGFLYYKWSLADVLSQAAGVIDAIGAVRFVGRATPEEQTFIRAARFRIQDKIKDACREVRDHLAAYDAAFASLTQRADPASFRDFLLAAPWMFLEVGERLGALQHIASFWAYRFGRQTNITAAEMYDIFVEYESSLGCVKPRERRPDAAPQDAAPQNAAPQDAAA